ncbi:Putative penicillin-binding protein PbpX [Planctomycetes bacterium Poly30]|uniref:Penicillin-binding protein PbpX n=1 Tax=Saltatorellus ferox TaxID=2528018 RepID=A0A518EMD8_9BACT|nr:Putative penicillin-binding protein PbpX [Planctomycetes bacterium Poly30]
MSPTLTALLALAAFQGADVASPEAFPASTPIAESLSPQVVADLSELVQSFVDDGEIVGGELLILKNGRTVLHGAYGWRDQASRTPMEPGGVFCVRSMTKPLIGTAIAMLVEDRAIKLGDPVSKYLPAFDAASTREITIDQLLHHTSGLPLSLIMRSNPRELTSLRSVADMGGGVELEFEPGTGFHYSDQGTDTLTALIEVVTGAPAEDFIEARILDPLGMGDSACLMTKDDPLRARGVSKYAGAQGSWTRFWSPEDEALFPIFLGSQGLYSTAVDYAKFVQMWMKKGRGPDGRLLRGSSVRRGLEPGPFPIGAPTGFPGLETAYGSLMQLWTRPTADDEDEGRDVVVFGHTGSDGTHAWAFPEHNAMVLYFTQSRGTLTGLRVEEQLGALLLGVPFDPIEAAPPLEQYLGYYCEDRPNDRYRSIILHEGGLALEILGKAVVPLVYAGDDRWKLKPQPGTVIAFDRGAAGEVTGYHIGEHQEFRFEPAADLPTADEVADHVTATHRIDRLESLGVLRMKNDFEMEKLGISGQRIAWYGWPDLWRVDESTGEETAATGSDGKAVRMKIGDKPTETLEGLAVTLGNQNSLGARFGDWRKRGIDARVIQRIEEDERGILLVRLGDTSGMATTLYVDETEWTVGRLDGMTILPGMGLIGQTIQFSDFRDLEGMRLPYRTEMELANPMIGRIIGLVTDATVGVDVEEGWFRLQKD